MESSRTWQGASWPQKDRKDRDGAGYRAWNIGQSSSSRHISLLDRTFRTSHNRKRRRRRPYTTFQSYLAFLLFLVASCVSPARAVFLPTFDNCLDQRVIDSDPVQLQFKPLNFSAVFDTKNASHNLNLTVYGTVMGSATTTPPPPEDSKSWGDPNNTLGKIPDVNQQNNNYSTFFARFEVLNYVPYDAPAVTFCDSLLHGDCPLGPAFGVNSSDIFNLPALSVSHDLFSSYAFASIIPTMHVTAGDAKKTFLACISANITPDLGGIGRLLTYAPLAVLLVVGFATISAAIFSPWGSSDTFKWTTNYGRDADLLRLITPGFGDCLQYIQFVVLTGSLTLNYPGYYQPVVSRAAWSTLMFNTSFVSHGPGIQNPQDGIYVYSGTYGLDRLSQLVGMSTVKDIWAGMIIWLLTILVAGIAFIQLGFFFRWGYRHISNIQEEDLRAKNMPFTVGNVVRVIYNYFLLPIIALSMFQFVVAGYSPISPATTAVAAVVLFVILGFVLWVLRIIFITRPRAYLFDDLPCVLLYGPVYNTYSDDAALFASVPLVVQILRGIAVGAVQPSGKAQIILLAICEIILILSLLAIRPFPSSTSMNLYHVFFAIIRLLTVFLSVAFVPELNVPEAPKGWIGYVILLMHAIVLVFGFLLNALQTLIEVGARLLGAGGEEGVGGGVARGGLVKVFGMRQLSRRMPRGDRTARQGSRLSNADLLADADAKSQLRNGRARSTSGSSAVLLNKHTTSDGRASVGLDSLSGFTGPMHNRDGSGSQPYTPTTPGGTLSFGSGMPAGSAPQPGGIIGLKNAEPSDPYYRPPRARRMTGDVYSPGARSRGSWQSADWANRRWSQITQNKGEGIEQPEGPSISGRATPLVGPAGPANPRELSDANLNDPGRDKPDYAVREVDFYYGVRGPALSNMPARRLGTGPADPTGPVASAAGWFKGLFSGKTKDKGKGFEVVRSSRAPPSMQPRQRPVISQESSDLDPNEPVVGSRSLDLDGQNPNPEEIGVAIGPDAPEHFSPQDDDISPLNSDDEYDDDDDEVDHRVSGLSDLPPSLPGMDLGGGIELPSRIGSKASSRPSRNPSARIAPRVPRKSSRRKSATIAEDDSNLIRLSTVAASPPDTPRARNGLYEPPSLEGGQHLRPGTANSSRMPFGSEHSSASGNRASTEANSSISDSLPPAPVESSSQNQAGSSQGHGHNRHSSSLLGALSPDILNDRPTSVGYVQQHRASDNMHVVGPGGYSGVDYQGSAAELIEPPTNRSSTSTERRRRDLP
ncbi:MAG: hypothetical protein M4579_002025 [Chaenotheca gracillima]|nr:MAG: hypothetical protein M4579_002025 [Chaenotheca gracillima]